MELNVKKIFLPAVGVDLVLNMDSEIPIARSSIIYDTDHAGHKITVAQPHPPITSNTAFKQLHLTTLVHAERHTVRIGISCTPHKFIKRYPLANKSVAQAIELQYRPRTLEANLRSAFRLPVDMRHKVKAGLIYNHKKYATDTDFRVKDISFTGIGIVVACSPEKQPARTSLTGIKNGDHLSMAIALVDEKAQNPLAVFPIRVKVVRVNRRYSDSHMLIGLKIEKITSENEDNLIRFIHEAQIAELNRISKKS